MLCACWSRRTSSPVMGSGEVITRLRYFMAFPFSGRASGGCAGRPGTSSRACAPWACGGRSSSCVGPCFSPPHSALGDGDGANVVGAEQLQGAHAVVGRRDDDPHGVEATIGVVLGGVPGNAGGAALVYRGVAQLNRGLAV